MTNQLASRAVGAPAFALLLLLAACAPGSDGASSPPEPGGQNGGSGGAGDTTVVVDAIAFGQGEITVSPGTTVIWENQDSVPHTVTHGEDGQPVDGALFDLQLPLESSASFTFDEAGRYPITCTIHPSMNMVVVVE